MRTYYFIGIGGIGMSGLALILLQKGFRVLGSDKCSSSIIETLRDAGAEVFIGHQAEQVPKGASVVYTTGIKPDHIELLEARRLGCQLLHRSQMLKELMQDSLPLLVSGSHGKTTTSALLAHVLSAAGQQPSFCIGGYVQSLQSQADYGRGDWFVAEADESDGSFLNYTPWGAILTNIGFDHMDYWGSRENAVQGFVDFQAKIERKELLFWCADSPPLAALSLEGVGYGFSPQAELRIENPVHGSWESYFDLVWQEDVYTRICVPLIGHHNILNAAAVFGLCLRLGLDEKVIRDAMLSFRGVKRRAEKKGEVWGIPIYDDYAHHPNEIRTTIAAMKNAAGGKRLVVVFQPHRFTRTRDCFSLFGPAFAGADLTIFTDIYGAGEDVIEGLNSQMLVADILAQGHTKCLYVPYETLVEELPAYLQEGDLLVSMGAGDITNLGPKLMAAWEK